MAILLIILTVVDLLLALTLTIIVLSRQKRNTAATWGWIFAFFILPYLGVMIYLVVGIRSIRRRKKISRAIASSKVQSQLPDQNFHHDKIKDFRYQQIFNLGSNLCGLNAITGNKVTIFENNGETFGALEDAIKNATNHIHLQYYIFKTDEIGERFKHLLLEKRKAGVSCRLLLDDVGCFGISKNFIHELQQAGVKCAFFMPLRITRPWAFQLRNHRKLAIIDGRCGFIGSQNIGNEYTRRKSKRISWRDTVIKIEGPAVHHLQTIFLEDWLLTTKENVRHREFFPKITTSGDAAIQVIPTGPDENDYALEVLICDLVHQAKQHLTITTPYLIPTLPLLVALEAAVKKGVVVEILLPEQSDHPIVDDVAKSWYRDLILIGVNLFTYEETFIHAKVITVDEDLIFIGSANIDERSFRLNFECSTLVMDPFLTTSFKTNFTSLILQSKKVTLQPQSLLQALKCGLFRLISPLL